MSLILLAGGKGTRLNTDKAFLEFNNKTIIENTIDKLNGLFDSIIIVANNNIEKYNTITKKYNNKFLKNKINKTIVINNDLIKNKGPLGGIYTGLKMSKDDNNFILACDMPFVSVDLIQYMLKFNDFDIVIPSHNGKIEPLYGMYNKNITPIILSQIKNNNLKIMGTVKKIKKIKYIEKEEIERFDKEKLCFFNINTREDLEKVKQLTK